MSEIRNQGARGRGRGTPRREPHGWAERLLAAELVAIAPAAALLVLRERVPAWLQGAALGLMAAFWLLRRRVEGRWGSTALDVPALLLLASLPGAVWVAGDRSAALSRALSLLAGLGLAYAAARSARRRRQAWALVGLLVAGGLGLVAVALLGVAWLDKFPLLGAITSRLPQLIRQVPHPSLGSFNGTQAAAIHPNSVAGLLILFLPLALGCLAAGLQERLSQESLGVPARGSQTVPAWILPLAGALLGTGGAVLLLTQSRGAWLALAMSLGLMVLRKRPAAWLGLGLVGVAGGLAVLWAAGGAADGGTAAMRLRLWRWGLALWAERPFFGIGLGNFLQVHGRRLEYEGGFVYQGFPHVHNFYLQAALDYGFLGLAGLFFLIVVLARAARRSLHRLRGTPLAGPALGLAFGLLAHALHGLVDSVSLGSKAGIVPWTFAGLLVGLDRLAAREREPAGAGRGDIGGRGEAEAADPADQGEPAGELRGDVTGRAYPAA